MAKSKKTSELDSGHEAIYCSRARKRRLEIGMTGEELGSFIGWTPQMVYRMEGGKLPRDEWRLVAIAKALNTDLNYLFGLTDEP